MQQQTSDQSEMATFYVVAIILGALLLIYMFFHNAIVNGVFEIKKIELSIIIFLKPQYLALMNWCNHVAKSNVSLSDMKYLAIVTGEVLQPWLSSICFIMACVIFIWHPTKRLRTTYTMDKLARKMKKVFPEVYLPDRQDGDLMTGEFGMALSPVEFIDRHGLRQNETLNIAKTHEVLSAQLGAKWSGHVEISFDIYILFASFVAHIARKRKQGLEILQLATRLHSANNYVMRWIIRRQLMAEIEEVIKNYSHFEEVSNIIKRHYYVNTLLCELLACARKGGVIPCSSFLWLKRENRTLWYALNNIGRKAIFTEACAITAHWRAEKKLKAQIDLPVLKMAISALQKEAAIGRT